MNEKTFLLICLILSVIVLIGFTLLGVYSNKKSLTSKTSINAFWIIASGVFLSALIVFFPTYYLNYFIGDEGVFEKIFKSLALSLHNTMRLFVLDGEFDALRDVVVSIGAGKVLSSCYSVYGVILFVLAPILTAGVVLTFVKNAKAYITYAFSLKKQLYYFSELNEKSIILATDVYKNVGKKALIIFLNVDFDNIDDELLSCARRINSVCFSGKEITEISLKPSLKNAIRKLYFISLDQTKNVENALTLIEKYRASSTLNTHDTQFYVFSLNDDASILLDSADNCNIKVRRVDESRNLVYDILRGNELFKNAYLDGDVKKINALILGGGKHGIELLKALYWYCQMVGYEISVTVVDKKVGVKDKFFGNCPEIEKVNGIKIDGDAYVNINFCEDLDVKSLSFRKLLSKSKPFTAVYSMLGDDDLNLNASLTVLEECGRRFDGDKSKFPIINAVVESAQKNKTIQSCGGLKNYSGELYGINLIGDIDVQYSLKIIEQQELEDKALKCHLRWSQTSDDVARDTKKFDCYEYFRRASVSEALYSETRISLNLLIENNLSNEELLKEYEHRRWNAYMRSEGYVFGNRKDSVYKTHPSLIPYERLSIKEKEKDKVVLQASEND